jgi:hypothetical protein
MRMMSKVFAACSILAGVVLVGAHGAAAAETCQAGSWTVSTNGPEVVDGNTKITYTVTGNQAADHAAAVVSSGGNTCAGSTVLSVTGSPVSGNQSYAAGAGDPLTGLGKLSCHDEAVKVNPNGSTFNFTVTVSGVRAAQPKTVALKKGNTVRSCEIVGIGDPGTPEIVAPVTEIIKEPASTCAVEFTRDLNTGKVLNAALVSPSHPDCKLFQTSADKIQLNVDDDTVCGGPGGCSLGAGKFGEGYVHSGTHSCTTRIIGGRVYTWGASCPE